MYFSYWRTKGIVGEKKSRCVCQKEAGLLMSIVGYYHESAHRSDIHKVSNLPVLILSLSTSLFRLFALSLVNSSIFLGLCEEANSR